MARILAISSQVASGHIGLSAIVPALHALGHEVIALPTVVLSNHPGHRTCAGIRVPASELQAMLAALNENRFLDDVETVLTGYFASDEQVQVAARVVETCRQRKPDTRFVCDPVLGDHPKGLYVPEQTAAAVRDELVSRADVILPNAFELSWLSGMPVTTSDDAERAAGGLMAPNCIATSVPATEANAIANIEIRGKTRARCVTVQRAHGVPNGTGDLFSGLIAAGLELDEVVAMVEAVIARSIGRPELALVDAIKSWRR